MDESHDKKFMSKILKIWSKTCVFCCKKYPIPTIIFILFFLLYLFFPLAFTFVIYSSPLVGFSLLVHRLFVGTNRQKVKHVEKDDRRKKFAKSRRSFKSVYSDRNQLIRRNTLNKSNDFIDANVEDDDNIFLKSLHDLLSEKKSKDKMSFESIAGKGECSSSNGTKVDCNINKDKVEDDDDKPQDHKVVRWTDDDQKNAIDLGLTEAETNKRLKSLMERRRSRKNLGFEEGGSTGNKNNVQISSVKTRKINPFLEDNSSGMKSPDSAPSSLLTTSNPFDLPYDPHEEKLDLTGDNFHEEFTVGQPKEPVFCRHQSFSLGALLHSVIARDKHGKSCYKDLSNKKKSVIGFKTSTLAHNEGDNKHIQHDSPISDDSIDSNHPKEEGASSEQVVGVLHEEDGTDIASQEEIDSFDERKADINFFYGGNKKAYHVASHSIVSDLQVELSDEDSDPTIDDLDIDKDRESLLNSSNPQGDPEPIQSNHIHEPHGASQGSVAQAAPDGLTELAVGPASVSSSSPKSVLQRDFINEVQQSDNHTREPDSSDNVSQQTNDSAEHPFLDRDIDNLQDRNGGQL
ncbi:hypothetical protein L1987_50941 [Smallanthus sonchifolius]|uniref:Uncharacterized protein n=1 Tax=Smallanthus sonchifolius TaxID=185202 RepID=A0ACB9EP10_9ASTR|nr:hypothetical protein L1987_50941 [Smallanthus sonchifolius]